MMRFLLFLCAALILVTATRADTVTISINRSKPLLISQFQHGVTHTQRSLDAWGDAASIARGKALLQSTRFHNQHIMGWGALNPEPAPDIYDWTSLDARMKLIRGLKGTPILTLCGAPDWMKGGEAGQTDWSKLEAAPTAEHYDDFAKLAATIARRYPEVKYFQVWNEFKGLWNAPENNWDYRGYTELYNRVYDALKAVDVTLKIGGPYLVLEGSGSQKATGEASAVPITPRNQKVLDYWLQHKHGADFITLDRSLVSYHDHEKYSPDEIMALTPHFARIAQQIYQKTALPLWWAEYYGRDVEPINEKFAVAQYASIWKHLIESGSAVSLLWEPQSAGKGMSGGGLFSDTQKIGGGQATALYPVYRWIGDHFSAGTPIYATRSSSPMIEALATRFKVLLINKSARAITIRCDGQTLSLQPYQVRLIAGGN